MGDVLKLGPHESLEIRSSSPEALEVEASYRPLDSPPPPHFHPAQDEHFEILEGAMRARVDGEELELARGAELDILRGQVHQMWNPGEEPARARWVTAPAGRTEQWFRVLNSLFGEDGAIATGRKVDFGACARSTPMFSGSTTPADPGGPPTGLCASCLHQQLVPNSRGSVFSLCRRSRDDPSYPRYPRLPVTACPGHEARGRGPGSSPAPR